MSEEIKPPEGTGPAGMALWEHISTAFELEAHELTVLGQLVRVADRIAALDEVVDRDGVMLEDPKRGLITHPALVESRQQRLTLARLLTALRLPDEDDVRPQRRGIRGVYQLRGGRGGAA